jgi:protoheme IX farnesyltransferase
MINYYLLTKPGIVFGNLVTVVAGFLLGSQGSFDWAGLMATFIGLGLIMASACVMNNWIDLERDRKMERTQTRPLVLGTISVKNALLFAFLTAICGFAVLALFTNIIALIVAFVGYFVYVVLYSLWKSKTVFGTAIGSVAGATPPVVGYTAASHQMDMGAILLFVILVLWQMPHFFAIALYHMEDYAKAGIPVLPLVKGIERTKIHMALYILLLIPALALLTYFGYTGIFFLVVMTSVTGVWLILSLRGFFIENSRVWGKQMFLFSLVVISLWSLFLPV